MKNNLLKDDRNTKEEYLDKIKKINLLKLDISNRNGLTGYLDFIKPNELGTNNIMKGFDYSLRPFFCF